MSSAETPLGEHLKAVRRILDSCGASEVRLLRGGGMGSGGGDEVHLLVEMAPERTLLDIVPAEERLTRLLERPVLIIPVQTLHPDQARRLKAGAELL